MRRIEQAGVKIRKGAPDFQFLILCLILVGFGLVMVFSASSSIAVIKEKFQNDPMYFTKRQLVWAGLGIICMFITMNIPFHNYKKLFAPAFTITIILLMLVPYIGHEVNGAKSWLGVGSLGIQPTELAKLTIVMYLAALISKKGEKFRDFRSGFIPVILAVGFVAGLIMLQPDLGSCLVLVACCGLLILAGGANFRHIFASLGVLIVVASMMVSISLLISPNEGSGYRVGRISSFLDPWKYDLGEGYNLINSLKALGHGGWFGAGFGQSIQKLHYLPYPYNDFIFAVIGEEFGFIGVSLFLSVYLYFIWRGLLISLRSYDSYGTLLGVGIMGMIAIQAFINIGGVSHTIPITGVTLPLISYGGSSLLITMTGLGIVLSISREYTLQTTTNRKSYLKSIK